MKSIRRLNFHHLYYFWMVAKDGRLTRVAGRLHISQSALSTQIRKLEEQLGQELFIREGKTLQLTELGNMVLNYAEGIFALANELVETISGGERQQIQQLRIGAVATLSRNFQDNFLRPIISSKQVRLVLRSGSLDELLEQLAIHQLDLVLSNTPVIAEAQKPWRCRRIDRQKVCLVGRPLAGDEAFSFERDLASIRLLLPGRSSDIRGQFDVLCEDLKLEPDVYAEVDDMAMLRLLTRDSGAVAVLPEVVVQDELRNGTLEKYCTVPQVYENFYAITTKRHFQPSMLQALLHAA